MTPEDTVRAYFRRPGWALLPVGTPRMTPAAVDRAESALRAAVSPRALRVLPHTPGPHRGMLVEGLSAPDRRRIVAELGLPWAVYRGRDGYPVREIPGDGYRAPLRLIVPAGSALHGFTTTVDGVDVQFAFMEVR